MIWKSNAAPGHVPQFSNEGEACIERLLHQYADWLCLKRAVAWIQLFGVWLKSCKPKGASCLKADDVRRAEIAIISYLQRKMFKEECVQLMKPNSRIP